MSFKRVLLLGGALGAIFAFRVLKKDIDRYDRMATMSGDKTLIAGQIDSIKAGLRRRRAQWTG